MNETLDIIYLKNTISNILSKVHTHPQKLIINDKKHDRLSFACPYCGDSHKDPYQKRGHLFFNNLYYKCYNEDCRSTFTKLCTDFDIKIDLNKKLELINYIDLNFHALKKNEDDWIIGNMNKLINFDDLKYYLDNSALSKLKNIMPVNEGSKVYNYLVNRGIPKKNISELFYECIKINNGWTEPYLIFINKIGDKIIGMQERNLKSGLSRRFKIWTFKELYESIYEEELDVIEAISYNKLSYLYNVLNVDFEKPITVFEGYIDSIFMPNSIGAVGINTNYSFLLNIDADLRFFFDNDITGHKKSYKYLKEGRTVFLWNKLIDDLSKKEINKKQFKLWFNDNIKDLNALFKHFRIHYSELYKYFSNNIFDIYYIPYSKIMEKENKTNKNIKDINIHKINWENLKNELT